MVENKIMKEQMNKEIKQIIDALLEACSEISELLRKGDTDITGKDITAPTANSSGEQQKPLDVLANEIVKQKLQSCPLIFALSSEEEENAIAIHTEGEYLVSFDPLDGSSNIDVNMCVGTIFSILKKQENLVDMNEQFLQKGRNQIAAGFAIYGPATTAIIGINTMDQEDLEYGNLFELRFDNYQWVKTSSKIKCPKQTNEYAINAANYSVWNEPIRTYIDQCLQGKDGVRAKVYNMRWLGSMVADMYRIFRRGGVFIYPGDKRNLNGKIRLLYEANPMSLLAELAGGGSTNGECSLLNMPVSNIHQKTPVMIGSEEEIRQIESLH